MKRLVILGSTGMLGSEVTRVAKESGIVIIEISRSGEVSFDATTHSFEMLANNLGLNENDWVVNCIGWIPQKASGDIAIDEEDAYLLNCSLPEKISKSKKELGFNWIQIGTDCVFSGKEGNYSESSEYDPIDLYGKSKAEGEMVSDGDIRIRCSVVGRDEKSSSGLYEWFKSQEPEKPINGFMNHYWNGVTTTAFAKLAIGLFNSGQNKPIRHHWVPRDKVSKYELLQIFQKELGSKTGIVPHQNSADINRILSTSNTHLNENLWDLAGYDQIPSIEELCQEFISIDKKLGLDRD